ncbi:Binding-protein-dependent transport system inner membrane component [Nocardia amikacinitolerans]|uniref:ATP-binding cassette domain-containing protein n=1 Tax=Nocardia amikacinitolerans TaxID=756689 RepID=UPI000A78819E|nr:ATP-binding cassette domain-containing protein [Nocardia amikacinitolerans]MCP2316430.1 Binding-protein-dependent transport system inner membrane component [Nocardia amikacinitolerans]
MTRLRLLTVLPALLMILLAVLGPSLAPRSAERAVGIPFADPSADAWLGTDRLGRDVLSHLLYGGWGLLLLAAVIAVLVTAVSSVLGAIAALRPRVGGLIETATDFAMLVPAVLGILLVLTSWPDAGVYGLIVVALLFGAPYCARVFTAAAAGVAASGYVEAARASGETLAHLVFREVLPNLREVLAAQLGLRFVAAVYLVSTASFLHLPTTLGASNWAVMVRDNASGMLLNPWSVLAPSLAIAIVAVSVNLAVTEFGRGTRISAIVDTASLRQGDSPGPAESAVFAEGADVGIRSSSAKLSVDSGRHNGSGANALPETATTAARREHLGSTAASVASTPVDESAVVAADGLGSGSAHSAPARSGPESSGGHPRPADGSTATPHSDGAGAAAGSRCEVPTRERSVVPDDVGVNSKTARAHQDPSGGRAFPAAWAETPETSDGVDATGAAEGGNSIASEPDSIVIVDGLFVRGQAGQELVGPVSFRMRPGTVTALTGPSGSGKTTVMRALLGHLPSGAVLAAGTVTVAEQSVFALDPAQLRRFRRTRVTYVGQDPGSALNPLMRVRTLLAEVAQDRSESALLEALAAVGLSAEHLRRRPGELSGGQQRRVALARALVRRTDIVVLDEPLAGLHGALRAEIASLLVDLAQRGTTILLSGHDTAAIHAIADQVIEVGTHPTPHPATAPDLPANRPLPAWPSTGPNWHAAAAPPPPIAAPNGHAAAAPPSPSAGPDAHAASLPSSPAAAPNALPANTLPPVDTHRSDADADAADSDTVDTGSSPQADADRSTAAPTAVGSTSVGKAQHDVRAVPETDADHSTAAPTAVGPTPVGKARNDVRAASQTEAGPPREDLADPSHRTASAMHDGDAAAHAHAAAHTHADAAAADAHAHADAAAHTDADAAAHAHTHADAAGNETVAAGPSAHPDTGSASASAATGPHPPRTTDGNGIGSDARPHKAPTERSDTAAKHSAEPALGNPQPPIALRANGISATIGEHRVLADIDLALTAGSALAVVGASGAGKTTLARVIAGLRAAEGGSLLLADNPIEIGGKRRIGRGGDGIQLVPQNPMSALNPRRTVAQTLGRPLRRIARVRKSAAPQRITELLDAVELPAELAARYPHELSGGQRQRVALARALAAEPSVLICDEITSALDHATAASIMALLDRIRADRGTALLVITHDMNLVAGHCAELVVLDRGRIVESGRTAEVLANPVEQATHDLLV